MTLLSITFPLSILACLLSIWLGKTKPASAALFTSGLILLLFISPLFQILPKWHVQLPALQGILATNSSAAPLAAQLPSNLTLQGLIALWLLGALTLTLRYISRIRTLHRWTKSATTITSPHLLRGLSDTARQINTAKLPALALSSEVKSPIVTGLFFPTILLPPQALKWSSETCEMVFLHELSHIKRHDLWFAHIAQLCSILHWFNPFIWLLQSRLRHQCEFAVDASIIANGTDPKSYITALCDVSTSLLNQSNIQPALPMAANATLKNRVRCLLKKQSSTSPLLVTSLLTLSATTTLAICLIQPTSPRPTKNTPTYSPHEINLRLSASPFPSDT